MSLFASIAAIVSLLLTFDTKSCRRIYIAMIFMELAVTDPKFAWGGVGATNSEKAGTDPPFGYFMGKSSR